MKNKIEDFIGKVVKFESGGLSFEVKVIDVKNTYGRDRYQIEPVKGEGKIWVEKLKIN